MRCATRDATPLENKTAGEDYMISEPRLCFMWDERTEHDSNRAYKFGLTVAWVVCLVFWVLLARGRRYPYLGRFGPRSSRRSISTAVFLTVS